MRGLGLAIVALAVAVFGSAGWSAMRFAETSTRPLALDIPSGPQRILILGYGGGDHPGAYLSDSLVLVVRDGSKQAEIPIPRDLWVQLPPNSGRYARINEALQQVSVGQFARRLFAEESVQVAQTRAGRCLAHRSWSPRVSGFS